MTSRQVDHALRTGRLHRVHRGVYAVGRPLTTPLEYANAAVLACGSRAALARLSALALHGLPGPGWPMEPVVLVAGVRPVRPGIEIHHATTLLRRDVTRVQGIAVTAPARTLLDCMPLLTPRDRRRAVKAALRGRLTSRAKLHDVIDRNRCHSGAPLLRELAAPPRGGDTRSPFEDDFETFCAEQGLPAPRMDVVIDRYEVDAYFPAERVIVELDGYEFHSDPGVFETDRERDAHHLALGIVTVRMTWYRIHRHPGREADRLHAILQARRGAAA